MQADLWHQRHRGEPRMRSDKRGRIHT
jgi:hypothetical protein